MMNKSLGGADRESSRNRIYGFRRGDEDGQKRERRRQKKSRRFRRLLKLITGRRQTEWTGATRCPNEDDQSHNRESLTDRKRTIFFRLRLPCRPLAELRLMPRMLRSTPHLRRGALLIRGPTCSTASESRLCEAARRALHRVRDTRSVRQSRFEKAVRRVLRRALLGHRHLQPLDFRIHQRDALD